MTDVFLQLGIVLGIAVVVSFLARYLRQPMLVGYIATGLIISVGLSNWVDFASLNTFAHLGVALLLFMVGLGISPRLVYETGAVAVAVGLGQIIFTAVVGYGIAILLGFSNVVALYLAVAFTFSSTIIIVQLLHERGDTEKLYGRIVIGMLLVQDLVAMVILLAISLFAQAGGVAAGWGSIGSLLIFNLATGVLAVYILGVFVLPRVDKFFVRSSESLLIFSLTVCFGAIVAFKYLGFPLEVGALLAGVMMASSPHQREIAARIKPLRDFFLVMFFVMLGSTLSGSGWGGEWLPAVIFSIFIIIGNPLIVIMVMKMMGYSLKTMFYAGLTAAQISEFSLILLMLGASLGHIPKEIVGLGTLVGIITIAASSYMIAYADELYRYLHPYLWMFEDGRAHPEDKEKGEEYEVFVFGAHRLGGGVIATLRRKKIKFLVVDYDPAVVAELKKKGVAAVFGDAGESDFLEGLKLKTAKMVVSSIPDAETTINIATYLKRIHSRAVVVAVGGTVAEAEKLYAAGAHYVVMPHYLGRRYLAEMLERHGLEAKKYAKEKRRHIAELKTAM